MSKEVTQATLHAMFDYDPDTGYLTWKVGKGTAKAGSIAGYVKTNLVHGKYEQSYRYVRVGGRDYAAHRLIWLYCHGVWPQNVIDHINRVSTDNRLANLRDVTQRENMSNHSFSRANKTGYRGVYGYNGKFKAIVPRDGLCYCCGVFDTPEDASIAYRAGREIFGLPQAPEHVGLEPLWKFTNQPPPKRYCPAPDRCRRANPSLTLSHQTDYPHQPITRRNNKNDHKPRHLQHQHHPGRSRALQPERPPQGSR